MEHLAPYHYIPRLAPVEKPSPNFPVESGVILIEDHIRK